VGIALWSICGLAAFLIARFIPLARKRRAWLAELAVALLAALLLGALATALDFGGWAELDWRAGLFAFLGAAAAVGVCRLLLK
jgi:uncharacterized membrane protein YeaQ/YmgE (transglycosylase-associated protein family)